MSSRAKGGRGELRFPECRSQQRTAECVKASLAATWELCELSFWGRAAIPTRGVLGPPLHLIDDPPLFPARSSCQPLCRAIWSTTPHPSPPRGISILVWVKTKNRDHVADKINLLIIIIVLQPVCLTPGCGSRQQQRFLATITTSAPSPPPPLYHHYCHLISTKTEPFGFKLEHIPAVVLAEVSRCHRSMASVYGASSTAPSV